VSDIHFSSREVEILVRLASKMGRGRTQPLLAASTLLTDCNELTSSRWALLSALRQRETATNKFTTKTIQAIPTMEPRVIELTEKLITRMISERGAEPSLAGNGHADGIWTTSESPNGAARVSVLLADWSIGPDGTRLMVSVHRTRGQHAFGAREIAIMKLIRLACSSFHELTDPELPRRHRQVLEGLERGLSEKQCAHELRLSRHTIHIYVKAIYRKFNVCSRAELLSFRFARSQEIKSPLV